MAQIVSLADIRLLEIRNLVRTLMPKARQELLDGYEELLDRLFEADFAGSEEMTERFDTGALTHMAEIIADQF